MSEFRDFLAMGGYALYVWPSYGATALVLGALYWATARRARRAASDSAAPEKSSR
jgi:heme exporter protein D